MSPNNPLMSRVRRSALLILAVLSSCVYAFAQQCDCPPVATCAACTGGMTHLTFKYDDPLGLASTITVTDGGGIIFVGLIADNQTFEVTANIEGDPFIGGQINVSSVLSSANITTGCGTPVFVGNSYGAFKVVAGKSMSGLPICCAPGDMETEVPTINNCPSSITTSLSSLSCTKAVSWTAPSAADNCGVQSFTSTHLPGAAFPRGTTTVTYTAIDKYGNTTTCSFTVQVNDITSPVISGCPANITVNADPTIGTCGTNVTWTPPTVADNCTVGMTSDKTPGQFFSVGTTPVTYTATDAAGNISTCTFNVIVNDITNPVISGCPSTITVSANAVTCGANVAWTPPTATDNCLLTLTSDKVPGHLFPIGTTPVTYTATDASGNISTCTFNVIVNDVTKPVIVGCPSNISLNTSTCSAVVNWTAPTATDVCGVSLTSNIAPGAIFSVGVTQVTYTATDPSGNSQTCTFSVTVVDNVAPVFSNCPSGVIQEVIAGSTCVAVATWTPPTASDNCSVLVTSNYNPGATFPLGMTNIIYTATDPSGNTSTCTFKIHVKDQTPPVITGCPSTITVNALSTINTCGTNVTWTLPTASDNCSVTLTSNIAPGQFFAVGTTAVLYTATDGSGNTSTCTFNVVVKDVTNPVIANCPSTITVSADATSGTCGKTVTWSPPTVSDNCAVTMISNKSSGQVFTVGTTVVTYTATDASGNISTCTFNVVVNDTTNPVISGCPTTITANALATTGTCGTSVTWTAPTVTDNCTVNMTSTKAPGDFFPVGTTAVTYTATDASLNTSTCTFNVVVTDVTSPVIVACPANISVNADATAGTCGKIVTWAPPTVTDNCAVTTASNRSPGQTFAVGTTTVTYTATDASGNISTCSFTVTVKDVSIPIISGCPATITVNADATPATCGKSVTWTPPTASDNCAVTLTSNKTPGQSFSVGTTAVTYTATDASGNVATCTFNVVVKDVSNPVIANCPSTITVSADATPATCGKTVTWSPPTATDNCAVTMTSNKTPGQVFAVGTTAVTYTATDASGNISTCTFNVVVNDTTNPVIANCPSTVTVNANTASGSCGATVTWTAPTVTDNCAVTMTTDKTPGQFFPVGTTAVVYTATDATGNVSTCTFNVIVKDVTNPILSGCPSTITVNALPAIGSCGANATWTAPVATDNCAISLTSSKSPGQFFPVGTTAVTYTATDASGNVATCSFNVVVRDSIVPTVANCPADLGIVAGSSCSATATWIPPTFADNCGTLAISSTHDPSDVFPVGETVVKYTATDASGNSTTCMFNVTVLDQTPPVFTSCVDDISIHATDNCTAIVSWIAPEFTDNCAVSVASTHTPGTVFAAGSTVVTYTATDVSGNSATCSFTVTVTDGSKPVFTSCPSTVSVSAGANCKAEATWSVPTFTDCSAVTMISTYSPGAQFSIGTTPVTYTATDAHGNVSTCSFNVVVTDNTAPVLTGCPAEIVLTASPTCNAVATWTPPAATDNCMVYSLQSSHQPGATFPIGISTVVYTAKDVQGNASTCEFKVIVKNATLPVIENAPQDLVVKVIDAETTSATWEIPTAKVPCGSVTISSNYSPGQEFPVGKTLVEYTAVDEAGNLSKTSFFITVQYEDLEFEISKLVTPDGDGVNDVWRLQNLEKFRENKVTVFDRWGGVVFSASGYNNESVAWNGLSRSGSPVPTGTYFYTIAVRYRKDYVEKKGFIELIR